jgi:hypothetical protein
MSKQWWLWLLLLLLLMPLRATAQNNEQRKQSHHPLPGGFDSAEAQELMAQRLQEVSELHHLPEQVKELLKDPKFREQIQNLSESDLQKLRARFQREGVSADGNWPQFLQQAAQPRVWNQRQIDMFRRLAERAGPKLPSPESGEMRPGGPDKVPPIPPPTFSPGGVPPQSSLPSPVEPKETSFERFQVKTTQWLLEQLDDVGGDMLQSITEMGGIEGNSSLAELLRSVPQSDFSGLNINENPLVPALGSGTFSRYLSEAGDFVRRQSGVWDKMGSFFREAPLPSLSNIRGPSVSMRAAPAVDSASWLPSLLSLLMLAVIILLMCRRGFGSNSLHDSGEGGEWRLGPWPVPPGAVSTRQDVIRAFEYLALLCLGPAAAACHHRQLAERLAGLTPHPNPPPQRGREKEGPPHNGREPLSPSPLMGEGWGGGNAGRRQAAEMLAWLYEQARYAPAREALSPEQLSDARHALCLLAGVTAV